MLWKRSFCFCLFCIAFVLWFDGCVVLCCVVATVTKTTRTAVAFRSLSAVNRRDRTNSIRSLYEEE